MLRRAFLLGLSSSTFSSPSVWATSDDESTADWRTRIRTVVISHVTSENSVDQLYRYQPVVAYFRSVLAADVQFRVASDYAAVVQALDAGQVHLAWLGSAAYATAWRSTGGQIEPVVSVRNADGSFGYQSVLVVRSDRPYRSIEDLRGRVLAFADPNSTSGYLAPAFFLVEQGYVPERHFSRVVFSGGHEQSIVGMMQGTYDAAATWFNSDARSNMTRMAEKGMLQPGSWRVVWTSPIIPEAPWSVRRDLPRGLKAGLIRALLDMPRSAPDAWRAINHGGFAELFPVTHEQYVDVIRMQEAISAARRQR